jgi:nucleoid DNA-binding protein
MSIKYYLQPNPITPDPNDQKARVQPNATLGIDEIVKRIVKRGTTLTETDVRAVLRLSFDEIADAVAEGNNVNLSLVNIKPSVQGVFDSVNDSFDDSRHTVRASVSAGIGLQQKMGTASVEKMGSSIVSPDIVDFNDVRTNSHTQASKGGIGVITGSELKFNPANATEGIFFVNNATNAETKVTEVAQRTEGKLMFMIPSTLVAGSYFVEVRKAYTNANSIRSDAFETNLTVV